MSEMKRIPSDEAKPETEAAIAGHLRDIIERRRLTPSMVAKSSDVELSTVTRFMRHERTLSLKSFDKIAEALGLVLVESKDGLR